MRTATSPTTARSEAEEVARDDARAAEALGFLCRTYLGRLERGDARPRHLARQLAFAADKIARKEPRS